MRIVFASMKGGGAKTTSVMWLAEALALLDAPVTVHDLDPQAGATKWRRVPAATLLCRVEPRTRSYHDVVAMLDEQEALNQ